MRWEVVSLTQQKQSTSNICSIPPLILASTVYPLDRLRTKPDSIYWPSYRLPATRGACAQTRANICQSPGCIYIYIYICAPPIRRGTEPYFTARPPTACIGHQTRTEAWGVLWDAAESNAGALSIIIFVGIGLDPCFIFGLFHNADACSQ